MQRIVAIAVVVACVLMAALSLVVRGDDAPETDPTDVPADPIVTVAAELQCDRQRFAFPTLEDLDAFTATALEEKGVSAEAYAEFERRLEDDETLRAAVLDVYLTVCGQ